MFFVYETQKSLKDKVPTSIWLAIFKIKDLVERIIHILNTKGAYPANVDKKFRKLYRIEVVDIVDIMISEEEMIELLGTNN